MSTRSSWWDDLDDELAAAGGVPVDELPDPWAGPPAAPGLTSEQERFLAGADGIDDQPPVPRLTGLARAPHEPGEPGGSAEPTGRTPGDNPAADP